MSNPRPAGRLAQTAVVLLVLLLTGCTGQVRPVSYARPPAAPSRPVTKLLVVVEENHSLGQVRRGMPYLYRLARTFGYAAR